MQKCVSTGRNENGTDLRYYRRYRVPGKGLMLSPAGKNTILWKKCAQPPGIRKKRGAKLSLRSDYRQQLAIAKSIAAFLSAHFSPITKTQPN